MSLPRRVPWASLNQLEQVYTAIYTSKDREFAIRRLSAWKYATGLPQALDATLSLLVAAQSDQKDSSSTCKLAVRQNYALALIRFVNGLVDPLQRGAYARSIAAIATQIDLPLSLVELRHACTHEELPSLQALRDGSKLALAWLETRYFSPTLESNPLPTAIESIPPLDPLLKQYKNTMKPLIKDNSLKANMQAEVAALLRSFDAWITEAVTTAWSIWDPDTSDRDNWALDKLATALTRPGGLVPVAKKKQPNVLEATNSTLWEPLLIHLQGNYAEFPSILTEAIVSAMLTTIEPDEATYRGTGYYLCLGGWLLWISVYWGHIPGCDSESIVVMILRTLPKDSAIPSHIDLLLSELKARNPHLQPIIDSLLQVIITVDRTNIAWSSESLSVMQDRLNSLQNDKVRATNVYESQAGLKGWRLLSEQNGWNPCPIGS